MFSVNNLFESPEAGCTMTNCALKTGNCENPYDSNKVIIDETNNLKMKSYVELGYTSEVCIECSNSEEIMQYKNILFT